MAAEDIAERFQAAIMPELQRLRRDNKELRAMLADYKDRIGAPADEIERLRRVEQQLEKIKLLSVAARNADHSDAYFRALDELYKAIDNG